MLENRFTLRDKRQLLIREAVSDDAAGTIEFLNIVAGESDFLSFGAGEFPFDESGERDFIESCMNTERHILLMGFVGDRLVSTLGFTPGRMPRDQHAGEFGVSVLKKYHGIGVGTSMIQTLIDWARSVGIRKINLRTRVDNHPAIRLYERLGFRHEGICTRDQLIDGIFHDSHRMGLEL